jgi:hypothetical protein
MEPPLREYFTPSSLMSSEKYVVYTSESALTVALRIIWRNPLRAILMEEGGMGILFTVQPDSSVTGREMPAQIIQGLTQASAQ